MPDMTRNSPLPILGATPTKDGIFFRVWAPRAKSVAVQRDLGNGPAVELGPEIDGYFTGLVQDMAAGDRYTYLLDGTLMRPDSASRCQPEGVHGPSEVVDLRAHGWQDANWKGMALTDYIFYELHVGAFSPEGTFAGVEARLDYLVELGITAVELMPVAQFPGERNWGYDGVYPFAVQASYGGPSGLMRLVDACHGRGLAVVLDVVYNHLGPEGNYLHAFGPYFTDRYRTPWGEAVNFDGPGSDGVRDFFIANALSWVEEFHIDALRLDAVHGIFDFSARHILDELGDAVHLLGAKLGRKVYVIAESDLNDSRLIRPKREGGYNLDAQWSDDFHHALHTRLTGERQGYYQDFGEFGQLLNVFREGYVYSGVHSRFRNRRHGNSAADIDPPHFVVFSQNHDQVGNRMNGDRLTPLLDQEQLKLAAATVLLAPYLPLLFMGEEYGETAPFQYFVSHGDPALIEAVRRGRQEEFAAFGWEGEVPDPQDEATFHKSRIDLGLRRSGHHEMLYRFYRRLIALRKKYPSLRPVPRQQCTVTAMNGAPVILLFRKITGRRSLCILNFGAVPVTVDLPSATGWDFWDPLIDSSSSEWGGPGALLQPGTRKDEDGFYTANPFSVIALRALRRKRTESKQTASLSEPLPDKI